MPRWEANRTTKVCPDCKQEFPRTAEYFHLRGSGHINSYCKTCASARAKTHYHDNHEEALEVRRIYREAHREEARYYHVHLRDKDKKRVSDRLTAQRYKVRYGQKKSAYYQRNKAKIVARSKNWALLHPEYIRLRSKVKSHRRRNAPLDAYAQAYIKILDSDPCAYCGYVQERMEIDHIQPVSKQGKGNWDNLSSACRRCNARKGNKTLLNFIALGGMA